MRVLMLSNVPRRSCDGWATGAESRRSTRQARLWRGTKACCDEEYDRTKLNIYASSSKVNSPAAPAVARKRQPWLPQDLCNNAVERAKIRLTVQRLSRGQCRHDRQRSSAPFPERLPRRADFAVPNFTCPYPVLRSENTVLITPFRRPKNCCVADLSATAAKTCAPRKSLTHSVIAASLGS